MEARFKNFGMDVSADEGRVVVGAHFNGRDVESRVSHVPANSHEGGGPDEAYISISLEGSKHAFEQTPQEKDQGWHLNGAQLNQYMDVEDARALRDALTIALDCADVK